jgi:hypothetical protein
MHPSHHSSSHNPPFPKTQLPFIFQRAAKHFLKCFRNPEKNSNVKNSKHSSYGHFMLESEDDLGMDNGGASGERGRADKDLATGIEFEQPVALRHFELLEFLF